MFGEGVLQEYCADSFSCHDGTVKVEGKLTLAMLLEGSSERQALPTEGEKKALEDWGRINA